MPEFGHTRSLPVVPGRGVAPPGQKRDKLSRGEAELEPILLLLPNRHRRRFWFNSPRNNRRRGRRSKAEVADERRRLLATLVKDIDALFEEMRGRMILDTADGIAIAYARFSTDFQHSILDQLRAIFEWALTHRLSIPRELVFFDIAISGSKENRPGLNSVRAALANKSAKTLLVFTTNRLFRKGYKCMKLVEEDVVGCGGRCVFIRSGIDTAADDRWRIPLQNQANYDEYGTSMYAENIRAAHEGLFLKGYVVYTLPYGFMGVDAEGPLTKRFLVRQKIAIDPVTAEWVRRIFHWFVVEGWKMVRILEKLNDEKVPCCPNSDGTTWTHFALHYLLTNPCYRGWWTYGKGKNVWQAKADYSRRELRAKPLREKQFEEFRVVPDEQWFAAQVILASSPQRNAGRKPKDGNTATRPRVLNGMLYCQVHDCPLKVAGTFGQYMICMKCRVQLKAKRPLYSYLNRSLALRSICRAIAASIREDAHLLRDLVLPSLRAAVDLQKVDTRSVEAAQGKAAKLTRQIEFVQENLGDSERDLAESKQRLRTLRGERAAVDAEIARIQKSNQRVILAPTEQDFETWIGGLEETLVAAASGDPADAGTLRRILELLTGGRVVVEQLGQRLAGRGWLRARFTLRLLETCSAQLDVDPTHDSPGKEMVVDIRESTIAERHIEGVQELYKRGVLLTAIGEQLGIDRHQVTEAMRIANERSGETPPEDGRVRRGKVKDKLLSPPVFQQIADEAKALLDDGLLIEQIAELLGRCPDTVRDALRHWFESRGQEMPDMRHRRKTLKIKNRPKE